MRLGRLGRSSPNDIPESVLRHSQLVPQDVPEQLDPDLVAQAVRDLRTEASAVRMLPRFEIQAWQDQAPWADEADVEQDLIITRALLVLFDEPFLRDRLAFRGGTALHKLRAARAVGWAVMQMP